LSGVKGREPNPGTPWGKKRIKEKKCGNVLFVRITDKYLTAGSEKFSFFRTTGTGSESHQPVRRGAIKKSPATDHNKESVR